MLLLLPLVLLAALSWRRCEVGPSLVCGASDGTGSLEGLCVSRRRYSLTDARLRRLRRVLLGAGVASVMVVGVGTSPDGSAGFTTDSTGGVCGGKV